MYLRLSWQNWWALSSLNQVPVIFPFPWPKEEYYYYFYSPQYWKSKFCDISNMVKYWNRSEY